MNCIPPNGDKLYKKRVLGDLGGRGNYQALSPFWDDNFLLLFHMNLIYQKEK